MCIWQPPNIMTVGCAVAAAAADDDDDGGR